MSKKMAVLLVVVLLINTGLALMALYVANLTQPADYGDAGAALAQGAGDLTQVAGVAVDPSAGDLVVPLKAMQRGGNFRVDFTGGKTTSFGREEHEGTWDELTGAVVYRPESQQLIAVEVTFAVTSLRTDALPLTNTVLAGEKWFDYENHPTARFTCDAATEIIEKALPTDPNAPTHTLEGTFTLNGITQDLAIPATLSFTGQTLTLDASFEILRSAFDVEKREGSLAGSAGGMVSEVDDAVQLRVRMTASPDPTAVIAELAAVVESQQVSLDEIQSLLEQNEMRLRTVEAWESRLSSSAHPAPHSTPINAENLPARFRDFSPEYVEVEHEDGTKGPGIRQYVPFEMILVPGNESEGIAPFYMSKLEVTWEMFRAWSYSQDIGDPSEINSLIERRLRPTPLFGNPSVLVQINNPQNPARAVSRLTAEAFCKWLTEKTGRQYRLPTEREWEQALIAGGGIPDDLDAAAWHFDNAPGDAFFGDPVAESPAEMAEVPEVGTKAPNDLGIHDMLGSVSEWVIPANPAERALRGGNMRTRTEDLVFGWREVEDREAWFASYPNEPKSLYWYPSYEFGGIRLVCEAQSVQDYPPTGRAPQE
ncbi:MAG: YceI family protein [Phycisphaerales bacterium JB063]